MFCIPVFTNHEFIMIIDLVYLDTLFEFVQTFYYRLLSHYFSNNQGLYNGWLKSEIYL